MTCAASQAKTIFPDSDIATSYVELGVEGIARLCPTGLWNHWIFRDILYDKEANTVVFVIQLNSWNERHNETEITESDVKKQTEWIVRNIMYGYDELIQNPGIEYDGDFMLYLSLGTLLKQMEKDGINLKIAVLKPDYENIVVKDMPMSLTSSELKPLINQTEKQR